MNLIARIKEQHIATYAILALAIPLFGVSHLSAPAAAAPAHPLWPYEPQPAVMTVQSCTAGEAACDCVLSRARAHDPLPEGQDLSNPFVVDEVLEDAYFKGKLEEKLSVMKASAPVHAGRARDAALANIRDLRIRAAKQVAGNCLTDFPITDIRSYHASGLAKTSVKQLIAEEFQRADKQRMKLAELTQNLRSAAP